MAAYSTLAIHGDEIYWQGELVALAVDRRDDTVMTGFRDFIADPVTVIATEDEAGKKCVCAHDRKCPLYDPETGTPKDYTIALDDVAKAATEYQRGGLLRMTDLDKLIASLKEST